MTLLLLLAVCLVNGAGVAETAITATGMAMSATGVDEACARAEEEGRLLAKQGVTAGGDRYGGGLFGSGQEGSSSHLRARIGPDELLLPPAELVPKDLDERSRTCFERGFGVQMIQRKRERGQLENVAIGCECGGIALLVLLIYLALPHHFGG